MKRLFVAALVWAVAAGAAIAQDCAYDRAAMVAMDFNAFDQTLGAGWRVVGDVEGCEIATADLIADYRTANAVALVNGDPQNITGLNWHEAQLRAAGGATEAALRLFTRSRFMNSQADWEYMLATMAFLEQDRDALLAARARLAALPEPEGFAELAARFRAQFGREIIWPTNLDAVDGFIACFDKPYSEAYAMTCRPETH